MVSCGGPVAERGLQSSSVPIGSYGYKDRGGRESSLQLWEVTMTMLG